MLYQYVTYQHPAFLSNNKYNCAYNIGILLSNENVSPRITEFNLAGKRQTAALISLAFEESTFLEWKRDFGLVVSHLDSI